MQTNLIPTDTGFIEVPLDHFNKQSPLIKLYYEHYKISESSNEPLIILHGGPVNAVDIKPILSETAAGKFFLKKCDIIYFHQRGAGKSQSKYDSTMDEILKYKSSYTIEQNIEDIEMLRKTFFKSSKKINIFGSSWGGILGFAYCSSYSDNVKRGILGSFDITTKWITDSPYYFDETVKQAMNDFPDFKSQFLQFIEKINDGKIVWRPNTHEQRLLQHNDIFEIIYVYAAKARYNDFAKILKQIIDNEIDGQKFINSFDLNNPSSQELGACQAGGITLCQNLVDVSEIIFAAQNKKNTFFINPEIIYSSILNECKKIGHQNKPMWFSKINIIRTSLLAFAGKWDPVVSWQLTEAASKFSNHSKFLLINGGHSPVKEGGDILAAEIEKLFKD